MLEIPNCNHIVQASAREIPAVRAKCESKGVQVVGHPFLAYLSIFIPDNDCVVERSGSDPLAVWGNGKGINSAVMVTWSF